MNTENFSKYLSEVKYRVDGTPKIVAEQTKIFKQKYSFSGKSFSERLIIWDYIWNNSPDEWTRMQSYLFIDSYIKKKDKLVNSWETIKFWQKRVDNWGYCDALSRIYTKILETIPDKVLKQLEQWNKSNNFWDRRQSLISLLYFSRTKKVFLPFDRLIRLIDSRISDNEYYVQKAVGWSLKELYNVYPVETLKYLNDNIEKISSIAFSPATEKINKLDKDKLKRKRKLNRQHGIKQRRVS